MTDTTRQAQESQATPHPVIADIRRRLRTPVRPFPPFAVKFANGRSRRVPQPGTLAIAGTDVLYSDRFDRVIRVPADQILGVIDLPIPSRRPRTRPPTNR